MSALITGAGGDIGRAIVARLRGMGCAVAATDLVPASLASIPQDGESPVFCTAMDVRDMSSIMASVAAAEQKLGPIDVLVNNAGGISAPTLADTDEADWLRDVDLNLNGPWRCIRAVQEGMKARGKGVIVNIASVNGMGIFGHPGYSVAKAGLIHLTRFCATEFGRHGVRAVAICPGSVRTQAWQERAATDPEILEEATSWYPSRSVCDPDDVAGVVASVVSDDFRMANGAVIALDGGLTAGSDRMASLFTGKEL